MTIKKYISTILNEVFILTVILFLLDQLTSFEIKNQAIKSFIYFGFLVLTPLTLIWNLLNFKTKKLKIIKVIIPTLTLVGILIISPFKIVYSSSSWKTQNIIYQNRNLNFNKVEFQMQDIGSLGYNKRTVEVIYLTDLFMIISPIKKDIDKKVEWIRIDKEINELGLK